MEERPKDRIVYKATVVGVSRVDVSLRVIPASDGEEPFVKDDDAYLVNVPGAANAEPVEDLIRLFGALFGREGAVRITIEPDPDVCGP